MLTSLLSEHFFLLLLIGLAAGFVDSIVGGGGLVSAPALLNMYPNIHILSVIGSQRTGSILGTTVSAINYFRFVKLRWQWVLATCICAFFASYLGVTAAQMIDKNLLRGLILVVIAIFAIYTFFKKDLGAVQSLRFSEDGGTVWACAAVGTVCGFYNGFIGPGAGTLLVFGFVAFVGFDFLRGSAIAKVANVSGDISSWIILFTKGYVLWDIAIPLLVGNIAGSYFGSSLAILKGSVFIRSVFLIIITLLLVRLAFFK